MPANGTVALLLIAGLLPSAAQVMSAEGASPFHSDDSWSWSDATFSVDLLVTNRHDELVDQWRRLSWAPHERPTVSIVERAHRNEKVHAVLVFRGCLSSEDGKCSMMVDYALKKPDGSLYCSYQRLPLWSDSRQAPVSGLVYLGHPYLEFIPEPGDPEGKYEVTARIRGGHAREVELKRALQVVQE